MVSVVKYRSGYKYQVAEEYSVQTRIFPAETIKTDYIALGHTGTIFIAKGYAWDGPSGPTIDTKTFMRGSLIHDAFYQLMREGHLHPSLRSYADKELYRMCLEDGMWRLRAWWIYKAVKWGGGPAVRPEARKTIRTAP